MLISFYLAGDSQKVERVFWKVYAWLAFFGGSRDLVLTPSRSDLVVQSSRCAVLVGNREILNLSMVSGPVKNERKKFGFPYFGVNKTNENGNT